MNSKELETIFKYQLKKDARTVSVATLLSNRYLKRIRYNPYYQRNYVRVSDVCISKTRKVLVIYKD